MNGRNGIVSWNITSRCNYSCSYCAQGRRHESVPAPGAVEKIADFIAGLGSGWEVKISGGEPFCERGFIPAVERLSAAGLQVSAVTNFSSSRRTLGRFIAAAGNSLRTLSVSLHLEYTAPDRFLDRCLWLKSAMPDLPRARMVVNSVLPPGRVLEILRLAHRFRDRGLFFYPQLIRRKGRPVEYNPEETMLINNFIEEAGSERALNSAPSLTGSLCRAGMDYFIITEAGECFSCYPGKRDGSGYLGGIAAGGTGGQAVKLREKALPCPYETCPCSVPRNRGIVDTARNR